MKKIDDPIFEQLEPRILLSGTPAPDSSTEEAVHVDVTPEDQIEVQDQVSEILFVDSGVEGYDKLIENFDRNVELVIIPEGEDGIGIISNVLESRENLTGIHIFSHGEHGEITLGNTILSEDNLSDYQESLQGWANSLTSDADILVYGCNFGQSDSMLTALASLTEADIAASDNLTGDSELSGDADLEVIVGQVETKEVFTQEQLNRADIVLAPNNKPVISVDAGDGDSANETVSEVGSPNIEASGTLSVVDVDSADTVSVSIKDVKESGTKSNLGKSTLEPLMTVDSGNIINNGSTEGKINWSFSSNPSNFSYLTAGQSVTLKYTLEVTDSANGKATYDVDITIEGQANVNPTASISVNGSAAVTEGSSFSLDGSGSTDSDGTIASYEWDLDNDGAFDDATGVSVNHTFADNGTYTVGLRVTDDQGGINSTTVNVDVDNADPVITAVSIPTSGSEGNLVNLDATATDAAGVNDTLTYTWTISSANLASDLVLVGSSQSFTPEDNGTYSVSLVVSDEDGGSAVSNGNSYGFQRRPGNQFNHCTIYSE